MEEAKSNPIEPLPRTCNRSMNGSIFSFLVVEKSWRCAACSSSHPHQAYSSYAKPSVLQLQHSLFCLTSSSGQSRISIHESPFCMMYHTSSSCPHFPPPSRLRPTPPHSPPLPQSTAASLCIHRPFRRYRPLPLLLPPRDGVSPL
jgi:hypothetical protein